MKDFAKIRREHKEYIGIICRIHRLDSTDKTLDDVAKETGYTRQAVQQFEYGLSTNMFIMLWYVEHGLNVEALVKAKELTTDIYGKL